MCSIVIAYDNNNKLTLYYEDDDFHLLSVVATCVSDYCTIKSICVFSKDQWDENYYPADLIAKFGNVSKIQYLEELYNVKLPLMKRYNPDDLCECCLFQFFEEYLPVFGFKLDRVLKINMTLPTIAEEYKVSSSNYRPWV